MGEESLSVCPAAIDIASETDTQKNLLETDSSESIQDGDSEGPRFVDFEITIYEEKNK